MAEGVVAELPSPSPVTPAGKVATLSFLQLCFACRVAGDGNLPPIWEALAREEGKMEGLTTLNQALVRSLPSFQRVFRGRAHFSASLPLLALVKNFCIWNPSLEPACAGGGFTPWLTRQGTVEASTRGGVDASLLAQ